VDKDTIKGILERYSPPLSPTLVDEIADAVISEHLKAVKELQTKVAKSSQSSRVTASRRGRTR